MQQNVGGYDRIARLVLGVLLVAVGVAGYFDLVGLAVLGLSALVVEVAAVLVGVVLLVTGATRSCPINAALGIDTSARGAGSVERADDAPGSERPKAD